MGKPDGSIRFCVDYRKVNDVSRFDAYHMPRVDELLDRLDTAPFFSTLDLTKGYWQIPLSPESKEKTAFAAADGLSQFRNLPFGLFGAPAIFQRLMDRVVCPNAAFAAVYLDDVIIHSDGMWWPYSSPCDSWGLRLTRRSVQLARRRYGIWSTTWEGDRCGLWWTKPQRLRPVRDPK